MVSPFALRREDEGKIPLVSHRDSCGIILNGFLME